MKIVLLNELLEIKDVYDEEAYIRSFVPEKEESFAEFLNQAMEENGLKLHNVMEASGINRNYGYNIFSGVRKHPSRDKVLALCIAMGLSAYETQKGLALSGNAGFNPENERDVRIIRMLNIKARDVGRVNRWLVEKGLEPLNV